MWPAWPGVCLCVSTSFHVLLLALCPPNALARSVPGRAMGLWDTGSQHILALLTRVLLNSSSPRIPTCPSCSLMLTLPIPCYSRAVSAFIVPGTFTSKRFHGLYIDLYLFCECFTKICVPLVISSMRSGTGSVFFS